MLTPATPPGWWNGRHGALKMLWPQGRAGSSPALGTTARDPRPDRSTGVPEVVQDTLSRPFGNTVYTSIA